MKTIEIYFDYASPWAYLASEIVPRRFGAATISWRPIYLRGLPAFATGVPYDAAKMAYAAVDFARCVAHEGVPFTPPASFPLDGLHGLRAAYVAMDAGVFDAFHPAMFRAAWAEHNDVSNKEVVGAILAAALGQGAAVGDALARMAEPAIKDRLRAATTEAVARGVFGVPTFMVGDEMFWGHDRMDYAARAAGV